MRLPLTLLVAAAAVTSVSPARAANPPFVGTRAMGMGGALRGAATGDSALTLNPSGMSLVRAYAIEAAYAYDRIGGTSHVGRLSIVDSTSAFNLGGGLYYNYLSDDTSPAGETSPPHRSGHEWGMALSMPLGEHFFLGGTVKYFRLSNSGTLPAGFPQRVRGFTFDAGLTIKPVSAVSIGVSGQNLAKLDTDRAPRTVGGGITLGAATDFMLSLDGVLELANGSRPQVWHVMGGGEYLWAKRFGIRAGGGRRGYNHAGFLTAGASFVGQSAAIDVGLQRDLSGALPETYVGASLRVFLPAPTE
jgi:hypothetical protein